jgi:DNA-binding IclR family transcriptional regulator
VNGPTGRAKSRALASQARAKMGLRTEGKILDAIAALTEPRGPTAPQVAEKIGCKRSWAQRLIARMVLGGLVREDSRGGALTFYTLTPLGHAERAAMKGDA